MSAKSTDMRIKHSPFFSIIVKAHLLVSSIPIERIGEHLDSRVLDVPSFNSGSHQ